MVTGIRRLVERARRLKLAVDGDGHVDMDWDVVGLLVELREHVGHRVSTQHARRLET